MNIPEVTFAFDVPTFAGAPVEGTEPDRSTTREMSEAYHISIENFYYFWCS